MNIRKNEMSNGDKDRIFGVKKAHECSTDGLELRYEVEHGQEAESNYVRQRVYRDKDNNYFMDVKGGTNGVMLSLGTIYQFDEPGVLIPVRPEALATWAALNLYGEEYEQALEEFKTPEALEYETVWMYQQGNEAGQQGYIYEFLWKTTGDAYVLFSTDSSYPSPGYNTPFINLSKGGTCRDDLYIYYVTPETARCWAEARGMDGDKCRAVFGH